MPIYPSSGGFIGSLLRTIQEERSKSPHVLPPAAEPAAPVRAAVQAPLESPISPESPGSSRVISVRPEGAPPTSASTPPGQVVPPQSMIGDKGGPGQIPGNNETAQAELNQSSEESNQRRNAIIQEHAQNEAAIKQKYAPSQPSNQPSNQPSKISDAMAVSNITDRAYATEAQRIRDQLEAAQAEKAKQLQRQEGKRKLDEQVARINANQRKTGLFQQLSSGIQGGAQSVGNRIKGLFQRLF